MEMNDIKEDYRLKLWNKKMRIKKNPVYYFNWAMAVSKRAISRFVSRKWPKPLILQRNSKLFSRT